MTKDWSECWAAGGCALSVRSPSCRGRPSSRAAVIGLEVVDLRANLLPLDELGVGVEDDYVLVREAWTQRRMHQIDDQQAETTVAPETSESH